MDLRGKTPLSITLANPIIQSEIVDTDVILKTVTIILDIKWNPPSFANGQDIPRDVFVSGIPLVDNATCCSASQELHSTLQKKVKGEIE